MSRTELLVVDMLKSGYDYAAVSRILNLSPHYIRTSMSRLFRRYGHVHGNKRMVLMRHWLGNWVRCDTGWNRLQPRERQVLILVLRGLKNVQVAQQLSMSVNAVTQRLYNISNLVGCSGRMELAIHFLVREYEDCQKFSLFDWLAAAGGSGPIASASNLSRRRRSLRSGELATGSTAGIAIPAPD